MEYVPHTDEEREKMLGSIGANGAKELFSDIPQEAQLKTKLDIPKGLSELEVTRLLKGLAEMNRPGRSIFIGAGAYRHFVPAAVDQMLLRGEFLTAYTPYQAEASQGNLQAIYEFQTLICQLTGMDLANASVYDGATAAAEAAIMACNITDKPEIIVSEALHPHYREVLATYGREGKFVLKTVPAAMGRTDADVLAESLSPDTAGVIIQSPSFFGVVEDMAALGRIAKSRKALFIPVIVEATSLGILKSPGELGADIAVGECQGLGNSLSYGGPYCGFMAARKEHMHRIPGRLVGETVDAGGKRGYILTLQAREQHIRRERAASNICTSQQLNALACAIHLALLGPHLRGLAELNLQKARYCRTALEKAGFTVPYSTLPHYNEFVVTVPDAEKAHKRLAEEGIIAGIPIGEFYPRHAELRDAVLLCVTELNTREEIDELVRGLVERSKTRLRARKPKVSAVRALGGGK